MKNWYIGISLLSLALLSACSSEGSASNGTGSNAGEAEIVAFVQRQDGAALARAAFQVWTIDGDSLVLDTALSTDENGFARLDSSRYAGKSRVLFVANAGDSLSAMRWTSPGRNADTLFAASSAVLAGKLLKDGAALSARVKVLDKESVSDAFGAFSIPNLPAGAHWVSVFDGNKAESAVAETTDDSAQTIVELSDSANILVEDFEHWNRRTSLGKIWGGGWWYASSDSSLGGNSSISPSFSDSGFVTDSSAYDGGRSLHANFLVDTAFTGHFALVGFTLGGDAVKNDQAAYYDLSSVSAVSFDIKGTGTVYLQFVYRKEAAVSTDDLDYANIALSLNPEWTRYRISTESVSDALSAVNAINWMAENDAELFLDNVRLEGVSLSGWPNLGL